MQIPCYMFDCAARLRPAAFFEIAQELAAEGAERLGFADHDLAPHDMVWILARMKVKFEKMPVRGDSVNTCTWHRGMKGLFFMREYTLDFPDGKAAAASTSAWVIMEKSTRRLLRPEATAGLIPSEAESEEKAVGSDAEKIILPSNTEMEKIGYHSVVYSDLDYNGHVNNSKYVVWTLDALPIELTTRNAVSEIGINFNREARPGDTVELFYCKMEGIHYVEGRLPEGQSFICSVRF